MDKGKLKVLRYLVKERGLKPSQALSVWELLVIWNDLGIIDKLKNKEIAWQEK